MTTHREQFLKLLLVPGNGDLVVASLAYYFSMSLRGVRVDAKDPASELRSMRFGNEILHVLAKQAVQYKGGAVSGYPEAVLVQILGELAENGDLVDELEWAWERTIADL
jgi:hypothetical protein